MSNATITADLFRKVAEECGLNVLPSEDGITVWAHTIPDNEWAGTRSATWTEIAHNEHGIRLLHALSDALRAALTKGEQ